MTIKEELQILRGEPIKVRTGNPLDIPCIETSDQEQLCKHPVVSVHMITYNHEPYIRQAIEGVMMQKTDFEFELVIGEDCSSDKTREICFEYQKRYPDKIRVLWCDHNLYRNPHPAGGNSARNTAHCRGEFIAFCEGDDYWIDPRKLQKQVNAFRSHPNVTMCFTGAEMFYQTINRRVLWNADGAFKPGIISGSDFLVKHTFGWALGKKTGCECFLMTASVMVRADAYRAAIQRYDIFKWKLALGDTTIWLAMASLGDLFYLNEPTSVYRQVASGFCHSSGGLVRLDSVLVRMYYAKGFWNIAPWQFTPQMLDSLISALAERVARKRGAFVGFKQLLAMHQGQNWHLLLNPRMWFYYMVMVLKLRGKFVDLWVSRYRNHMPYLHINKLVRRLYEK